MPVKRRLAKGRERRITDETVQAFRASSYTDLHRALGLKPWEESPLYAVRAEPPDWMRDERRRDDWRQAWELRQGLEAASK